MDQGTVAGFVAGIHDLVGKRGQEELEAIGVVEKSLLLWEVAEDGAKLFRRRLVAIGLPVVDVEQANDLVVGKVAVIGVEKGGDVPYSFGVHHFELKAGLEAAAIVHDL